MKNFVFHKYRCAQSMPILVVALKSQAKTLCQKRGGVLGEGAGGCSITQSGCNITQQILPVC